MRCAIQGLALFQNTSSGCSRLSIPRSRRGWGWDCPFAARSLMPTGAGCGQMSMHLAAPYFSSPCREGAHELSSGGSPDRRGLRRRCIRCVRLGGPEIDDQFDLCRLGHGQVSRPRRTDELRLAALGTYRLIGFRVARILTSANAPRGLFGNALPQKQR